MTGEAWGLLAGQFQDAGPGVAGSAASRAVGDRAGGRRQLRDEASCTEWRACPPTHPHREVSGRGVQGNRGARGSEGARTQLPELEPHCFIFISVSSSLGEGTHPLAFSRQPWLVIRAWDPVPRGWWGGGGPTNATSNSPTPAGFVQFQGQHPIPQVKGSALQHGPARPRLQTSRCSPALPGCRREAPVAPPGGWFVCQAAQGTQGKFKGCNSGIPR